MSNDIHKSGSPGRVYGSILPVSMMFIAVARPSCLRLLMHEACWAFDFAFDNAGNSIPAKIAIIAITTSNSSNVKPPARRKRKPRNPGTEARAAAGSRVTRVEVFTMTGRLPARARADNDNHAADHRACP